MKKVLSLQIIPKNISSVNLKSLCSHKFTIIHLGYDSILTFGTLLLFKVLKNLQY